MLIKQQKLQKNEQGFASLVIGLVLIVVLALMTVGFAQLTRHEQQQALNKQLATQAYYAAESGVNDASQSIIANLANDTILSKSVIKTQLDGKTCLNPGIPKADGSGYYTQQLNALNRTEYTCAMISLKTDDLKYDVAANKGQSSLTETSAPLSNLTVEWTSKNGKTAMPSGLFTKTGVGGWDSPAVLQFSLTPLNGGTGLNHDNMISNTKTFYLYPSASGSDVPFASDQGTIGNATCSGSTCTAKITGISGSGPYLIHFLNLYDDSTVLLSSSGVTFSGAQAVVDVTGKAQNVLKRIQVRVRLPSSTNSLANYALEAQDICKRIIASPVPGATTYDTSVGGSVCNLSN